jgi:hypothetical protein
MAGEPMKLWRLLTQHFIMPNEAAVTEATVLEIFSENGTVNNKDRIGEGKAI